MRKQHTKRLAHKQAYAYSLPNKVVSLFTAFILAFGLFPAAAFADESSAGSTNSARVFSLGSSSSSSSASSNESAATSAQSNQNAQAQAQATVSAQEEAAAQLYVQNEAQAAANSPVADEEEEIIELSPEPLNLIQNGNYTPTDSAANPSTNATASTKAAPTSAQRNIIKSRLNTALVAVSYEPVTAVDRSTGQRTTIQMCKINIEDLKITYDSNSYTYMDSIVEETINSNPDLFYAGAGSGLGSRGSYVSSVTVQYYFTPSSITSMKTRFETAMQNILKWVPAKGSDAEKAKAVHDWLVRNVSYDTAAANQGGPEYYGKYNPWTAYGAANDRLAVCQGYSLAFISAMGRLGIQATFVENSYANHGWNRVRLYDTLPNGSSPGYYWFNMDVTWDDPLVNNKDQGFSKTPSTKYFLKSDSFFKKLDSTHSRWSPAGTAGTNTKYDNAWNGGTYSGNAARGTITSISISPNSLAITPDSSAQLTLNVVSQNQNSVAGEAKWTSSNPSVAAVSSNGLVTAGKSQGTATITATLGGRTATCTVTVKDGILLTNASVTVASSKVAYKSGVPQRPAPTVKVNGKTLKEGTDYKITWPSDTVNPGVKTATITGLGDYTGTKTFTYTITGNLSGTGVAISPVTGKSYAYTGAAVKPTLTIKFGSTTLQEGTDYTVTWPSNLTNVGTKTVKITGKGAYTGTTTYTYTVTATKINSATVTYNTSMTYTGKAITQSPTVKLNGNTIPSSNYTITYKNNVNVGTATMTITGKGNFTGSIVKTFSIVKAASVVSWTRLAGSTQFQTMRQVVGEGWAKNSGGTVVVATSFSFQDALSAAAVAGKYNAPILITEYNKLTSETKAELDRIRPSNVIIVGGQYVVTPAVEKSIKNLSYVRSVARTAGASASETAAKLATKYFPKGSTNTAILATSQGYWDALSASPVAYSKGYPIFLVDSYKSISSTTLNAMKSCGITNVVIVGGKWAVDPATIEAKLKSYGVKSITRKAGDHYWDTSRLIGEWGISLGLSADKMGVATGFTYSDALCGAPLCGKNDAILVLTEHNKARNTELPKKYKAIMSKAYVFGGKYVVTDAVFKAFQNATKK